MPSAVVPPKSLAEVLSRPAREATLGHLVYWGSNGRTSVLSYSSLLIAAESLLAGLRRVGVRPRERVILQAADASELLPAFWGCVLGGFVPVLLPPAFHLEAPHEARRRLAQTWVRLGRPTILATAQIGQQVLAATRELGLEGIKLAITNDLVRTPPDTSWSPGQDDDPALVILTSGSTAAPKLVRLTHHNFIASVVGSAVVNHCGPDDVSLNWLPLYHIGGLMRSVRDLYAGCKQVQVPTELVRGNPLLWIDLIDKFRATTTWAPNTAFGMVVARKHELPAWREWDLGSIRSLYSSGEPVVARTMLAFHSMLAHYGLRSDAFHAAWGMSEACSATSGRADFFECGTDRQSVLQSGGAGGPLSVSLTLVADHDRIPAVGQPTPGVSVRIVDGHDGVVPEGIAGPLQIDGALVCQGYEDDDALNGASFTADGWLRTGDLGVVRDGRLTIIGRESDLIIVGGVNVSHLNVEAAVEKVAGVEPGFTAACAVRRSADDGEALAVFLHTPPADFSLQESLPHTVRGAVARVLGFAPRFVIPLARGEVPKSTLGKIRRSELRERFAAGAFDEWRRWPFDLSAPHTTLLGGTDEDDKLGREIASVIAETLGRPVLDVHDNVFALGGGSLQVARAVDRLNQRFPTLGCSIVDLFRFPTPATLARYLSRSEEDRLAATRGAEQGTRRQIARGARRDRAKRHALAKNQQFSE